MVAEVKNEKVYRTIINHIKDEILNGNLKKGDKLPSERDMADKFKVSRASVREALIALEMVGLIESKRGSGNYIRESFDNSFLEPMSIMFILENMSARSIYEFRCALELEAIVIATEKIEYEEIINLENILNNLTKSDNEEDKSALDKQFHYAIVKATKNLILINFYETISKLMDNFIKISRGKILSSKGNEVLIESHTKIFNALRDRNTNLSYKEMKNHLEIIKQSLSL